VVKAATLVPQTALQDVHNSGRDAPLSETAARPWVPRTCRGRARATETCLDALDDGGLLLRVDQVHLVEQDHVRERQLLHGLRTYNIVDTHVIESTDQNSLKAKSIYIQLYYNYLHTQAAVHCAALAHMCQGPVGLAMIRTAGNMGH